MKNLFYIICFIILSSSISMAEVVKKITISGNNRIADETIKIYGNIELNKEYSDKDLDNILKDLYKTDFFEVKPPVAFLPYVIANLFENETLAIRIIGFLIIALCSYFIFKQSSKITSSFIAKIITLSFVILNSQITFQNISLTIFIYPFYYF